LTDIAEDQRLDWLSKCYVDGNEAYESEQTAKNEIEQLNKAVYELHDKNDHESRLAHIYWT
jgi:hypothetical protein